MSDLSTTIDAVSQMINDQAVDQDLLGELELPEVLTELARLVTTELQHLDQLETGNDEHNEQVMRNAIHQAAVKSFFAGLAVGRDGDTGHDHGIVVTVAPEMLEAIGVGAIRDGAVSFTLTTPIEEDND